MVEHLVKFLIVEDDESQRMILKSILKKNYTCEIKEASNGNEALEQLNIETPTLILLDLSMPQLGGAELLEIFQTNPNYKKIPVIVTSANNDRKTIGNLVNKGIYDYILKPIERNSALSRINKVLLAVLDGSDPLKIHLETLDKRPKLLLVEPDKYQRELIDNLLGYKFAIHAVRTGMDALSAFEKIKHPYILLSDKAELLDKKIVTQKIREIAEDKVSIYLIYSDTKTISQKIFNFDGMIKRSINPEQFRKDILDSLKVSDE